MTRVLIIHNAGSSHHGPSGEELVAREEAEALALRGHDVILEIVSDQQISRLEAGLQVAWSLSGKQLVSNLIRRHDPAIVHFHGMLPHVTASGFAACVDFGVPALQTLHNFRWLCVEGGLVRRGVPCAKCLVGSKLSGIAYSCAKNSVAISGGLVAGNSALRAWLNKHGSAARFLGVSRFVSQRHINSGFPSENIATKYNGVAVPQAPIVPSVSREGIVFVGRMTHAKGAWHFAQAARHSSVGPFRMLGAGPELIPIREWANSSGTQLEVLGAVARETALAAISRASAVVVPSVGPETFGRVAVEAMLLGTPVITSGAGALAEVVGDAGLYVTLGDSSSIAKAAERLERDPSLFERLQAAGHRQAAGFTMSRSVASLEVEYREAIRAFSKRS